MSIAWWELAAAVVLDLSFGDPRWLPHPIRAAGWLIVRVEAWLRRTRLSLKLAGVLMWLCVSGVTTAFVWATLPWFNIYWIWALLALRSLDIEASRVVDALSSGDLEDARGKLAMIVGRDTAELTDSEVLRAVVETMAENTSDAVIAPLFYLAIGGPAAMALYKAANTMDSMVGYKNERYREFGWFSARMDDILNFIPARVTAVLVWLTAAILRLDALRSIRVTLRDARLQPSPNAGWPEAAFAGALRVRLGGINAYHGVRSVKSYIGDPVLPLDIAVFRRAKAVLYGASFLMIALILAVIR